MIAVPRAEVDADEGMLAAGAFPFRHHLAQTLERVETLGKDLRGQRVLAVEMERRSRRE